MSCVKCGLTPDLCICETIENIGPSMIVFAEIVDACLDGDGNGHIFISKHRRSTLEKTIKEFLKHKGKSVSIYITDLGGR
jgi:hypothetical protein